VRRKENKKKGKRLRVNLFPLLLTFHSSRIHCIKRDTGTTSIPSSCASDSHFFSSLMVEGKGCRCRWPCRSSGRCG